MECGRVLIVATIFSQMCCSHQLDNASWSQPVNRTVHIHQHNGFLTSINSSDITREEGMYFLNLLFIEYGSGDMMDQTGLEKLLGHVGYIETEHTHQLHLNDTHSKGGHGGNAQHPDPQDINHEDSVDPGHSVELEHSKDHDHDEDNEHSKDHDHDEDNEHSLDHENDTDDEYSQDHEDNKQETQNSVDINVDSDQDTTDEVSQVRGRGHPGEHGHVDGEHSNNLTAKESEVNLRGDNSENEHETKGSRKTSGSKKRKRKGKKKRRKQKGTSRMTPKNRQERSAESVIFHKHDIHMDCLSIKQLKEIFHFDEKQSISKKDFLYMSPAIIFQLNQPHCRRVHIHQEGHRTGSAEMSERVWGYSSAAVVVISLVGLLAVAAVPVMQRLFFKQLLQFLVAMAVGALTGDAMLHLLPHAIVGENSGETSGSDHDHTPVVWKGLCGLAGIYVFFIIQRLLTFVSGVRNKRWKGKKARRFVAGNDASNITKRVSVYVQESNRNERSLSGEDSETDTEQLRPLSLQMNDAEHIKTKGQTDKGDTDSHLSHGHSHGAAPSSVSAVAWMIVLGDGVHNLSDGLAIGVAFSNSITGGFSTAIAVFCHELPHEIGDFAVLLNAGMSVKRAILCNCLSSLLCFIGMLIGVALGNIQEASSWIFAGVAGMFIYISLVTMLPELTSINSTRPLRDLFLQCCGLVIGSGIMLTIAVYEEDLKSILD